MSSDILIVSEFWLCLHEQYPIDVLNIIEKNMIDVHKKLWNTLCNDIFEKYEIKYPSGSINSL